MTASGPQSPRAATFAGLLAIAAGIVPILIGTGVAVPSERPEAPGWVLVAAGLAFVCAGGAIIVGYTIGGGIEPDGDLPSDASQPVRAAEYLLGFCVVGLLFVVASWVAFWPGERHFSSIFSSPPGETGGAPSEWQGRVVFGAGAVVLAVFWIASTIINIRRLTRSVRRQ